MPSEEYFAQLEQWREPKVEYSCACGTVYKAMSPHELGLLIQAHKEVTRHGGKEEGR